MTIDVFAQRDRWLEELGHYVNDENHIICEAGYMTLPAIASEILESADDSAKHTKKQMFDWQSRGVDLRDALTWLGPDVYALISSATTDLHKTIMSDLLTMGTDGKPKALDDAKRPDVAQKAEALDALVKSDAVLAAAWSDLVEACKDVDHVTFPADRVKYLRDNVVALCARRKQDPGWGGPLHTAYSVLLGDDNTVRRAQWTVGDPVDPATPGVRAASSPSPGELEHLARRVVVTSNSTEDFVVWFRIDRAYIRNRTAVSHGDVTFYSAMMLAAALTDHDRAREIYDVVPDELLTDEVRDAQLSDDGPDEHRGFEHTPGMVFARVMVNGVEHHLARSRARTLLDAVLKVGGTSPGLWQVLDGSLMFGDTLRTHYHSISWPPKAERDSRALDYENDHFATIALSRLASSGATITADAAEALRPALRLQDELRDAPDADPEAVVRAAVRAIEHCNTWTEAGQSWATFLDKYLLDSYTVETFAFRTVNHVFTAAVAQIPDHSPGAPTIQELIDIKHDIQDNRIHGIIRSNTPAHTTALRRIYQNHWLARSLSELDDTLASAGAMSAAFDRERSRVAACTNRLRRSRNAAIHGGPISPAACETIVTFARRIAGQALNNVIEACIDGVDVEQYTHNRRSRYEQRAHNLTTTGALENLFDLPSAPGQP